MIVTSSDLQQELLAFLSAEVLPDHLEPLTADASLFTGLLDSLGTLRLIVFLEEKYSIQVQDGELIPENFENVTAITRFIKRKLDR